MWEHIDDRLFGSFLYPTKVPEARRQEIGTALTLAPLQEARDLGYRVGVLTAEPTAQGAYRRLGFEECCKFGVYAWVGEKQV